jgi:hypothetical protein
LGGVGTLRNEIRAGNRISDLMGHVSALFLQPWFRRDQS